MPVGFLMDIDNSQSTVPSYSWLKSSDDKFQYTLNPRNIVYIGLRDVDPAEKAFLKSLKIKHYNMSHVDEIGIKQIMKESLEYLNHHNGSEKRKIPIHLSFDIDALDVSEAPATGTSVPGGLTLREGRYIVEKLFDSGQLVSMDLVEVNPMLGKEGSDDVAKTVNAGHLLASFAMGTKYV